MRRGVLLAVIALSACGAGGSGQQTTEPSLPESLPSVAPPTTAEPATTAETRPAPESLPPVTIATTTVAIASEDALLEAAKRYMDAERNFDAQAMYDLHSEECKTSTPLDDWTARVENYRQMTAANYDYEPSELTDMGPSIELIDEATAKVYYYFVAPDEQPAYGDYEPAAQWWRVASDGTWRRDECNEPIETMEDDMDDDMDDDMEGDMDGVGGSTDDSGAGADANGPGSGAAGTLNDPVPMGTPHEVGGGWILTFNSVSYGMTEAVMAVDPEYDSPDLGYEWVVVNATERYDGPDDYTSEGIDVEFVRPDGEVVATEETEGALAPPPVMFMTPGLARGSSVTANLLFQLKSGDDEPLLIGGRPGYESSDNVYFAIPGR